ncbi:unnamed protein product [Timema podura]|uniref:Neuropeptide Y n=1 Tax=Timema podura TaxID=61482 RepID=A0ABN7NQY1_TIMPD|nr:unnamed protein product [Timema podura]
MRLPASYALEVGNDDNNSGRQIKIQSMECVRMTSSGILSSISTLQHSHSEFLGLTDPTVLSVPAAAMQCPTGNMALLACVCIVLGLSMSCCCDPLAKGPENMARPARPKVFATPEELRSYLEEVSNYYAIAGRPRFGKRLALPTSYRAANNRIYNSALSPAAAGSESNFRYPPSPSDLYEMIFQYDE